mmetsp:Transcript_7502/g.20797  ORF Transcript_7502/g.20797 Transcript_7502/m.20797 type:complete len:206 (+) Transcript_7502:1258-1875(+)
MVLSDFFLVWRSRIHTRRRLRQKEISDGCDMCECLHDGIDTIRLVVIVESNKPWKVPLSKQIAAKVRVGVQLGNVGRSKGWMQRSPNIGYRCIVNFVVIRQAMKRATREVKKDKMALFHSMCISWGLASPPSKEFATHQTGVNVWTALQTDAASRFVVEIEKGSLNCIQIRTWIRCFKLCFASLAFPLVDTISALHRVVERTGDG